ncbi:MAG: HYC_CC_PP family protein [Chitinophagales bacterium]
MFKKAIHIILALLIIGTSMGLTINKHYCQNQLKGIAVFFQPPNCHDLLQSQKTSGCKHHQAPKATCKHAEKGDSKGCCSNESEYVHLEENLISPSISQDIAPDFEWTAILHFPFNYTFISFNHTNVKYQHYSPPLLCRDITLLVQSFLC